MAPERNYKIDEVCISLIKDFRFYATILSKMIKTEIKPTLLSGGQFFHTMGVGYSPNGKLTLFYCKEFMEGKSLKELQAVVIHECLHVFYRHLIRFPRNEIPPKLAKLYNIGMDMAINQDVEHLPEGCVYPSTFKLPDGENADFYIAALKKMLQDQAQKSGECPMCGQSQDDNEQDQDGQGQGQGDGDQEQDQDGQGQGDQGQGDDEQDQDGQGQGDGDQDDTCPICGKKHQDNKNQGSHAMWDKVVDDNGKAEEYDSEKHDFDREFENKKVVLDSIKECQGYGTLPANVEREIKNLQSVKRHNWKHELNVFVNSMLTVAKRLSQKRVNRRFMNQSYILPGKKKARRPNLLIARDTSGSCYDDKVQADFLNEMIQISKFANVYVADCDTQVHQVYQVKRVSDFASYQGGGGTSFEPVFEEAKKVKADGIIYLTDTDGSFPDKKTIGKYASNTIWVTIDDTRNIKSRLPFGKHINIDTSQN